MKTNYKILKLPSKQLDEKLIQLKKSYNIKVDRIRPDFALVELGEDL